MVQKILKNEIINKYKVNRYIPKKPEKKINNNLTGGVPIGEHSVLYTSYVPFQYRVILYSVVLILLGFVLKINPNNIFGAEVSTLKISIIIFVGMFLIIIDWYINVFSDTPLDKKKDSLQNKMYKKK